MLQLWKVTNFLVRFFVFETVVTASGGGKDQIYIYMYRNKYICMWIQTYLYTVYTVYTCIWL